MKYCSHCGKEIMQEAVVCPNCGCATENTISKVGTEPDVPSTGLNVLSFLIPVVGLILFIIYHEKAPVKAKAIGKWALIGFVIGLVFQGISWGLLMAM